MRLAEEVATLDHLSHGRLDLGIGRSSFPRSYEGYNIAYAESRARFREYLDVMRLAWTQECFSSAETFYAFRDVELIPKPYQHSPSALTSCRDHTRNLRGHRHITSCSSTPCACSPRKSPRICGRRYERSHQFFCADHLGYTLLLSFEVRKEQVPQRRTLDNWR